LSRLIVVSNRVAPRNSGDSGSVGGLAIAMRDALKERGGVWFGWSGRTTQATPGCPDVAEVGKITYATVDLNQQDYDEYYTGFANSVLWPLFHYRLHMTDFSRRSMAGYHRVNALFARQLLSLLRKDDVIWVHDYHFIPLAHYLRQGGCRNKIGFFLHIPWPPEELLVTLPNHESLVGHFCNYDLVGFQTENDLRSFLGYVRKEAGGKVRSSGLVKAFGHQFKAGVFPISIDTESVAKAAEKAAGSAQAQRLKDSVSGRKLIIGTDRLDYTKGLVERMEAYQHLLTHYPEYRRQVVYIQIAPPSRAGLPEYQLLRRQMESAAGHINGSYADFDWSPVRYLNRAFKRQTLLGFLRISQVGLVTPLRDGMNLVAKEYVVAQPASNPGVLVLSRFAGAASELDGALIVNPYDAEGVGEALASALSMPLQERKDRWGAMYQRLKQFDLVSWRESYMEALQGIRRAA
jgi:trehalose 6-phosphate synthase